LPSGIASAARVVRACGTYSWRRSPAAAERGHHLAGRSPPRLRLQLACSAAGIVAGICLNGAYSGDSVGSFSSATVAMDTSRPVEHRAAR
jgi:hypothetical protein